MKLNVKLYSQADSKWGSVKLGSSTVTTIKSHGCLLTDVAMVCSYFGKDTDPQKLNTDLIRVKGYINANRLVYGAITDIYPDITVDWENFIDCSTTPAPLDKIDSALFSKRPVLVKVDYDNSTGFVDEHWITIVGKTEDGSYLCNDPIDGTEIFFQARYGDPARYIFKIVTYFGPIPAISNEDKLNDLQDKVKSLNEQVAKLSLENNTLRTELETQEKDNEDLAGQLNTARTDRDKLDWENKTLQIKVDELQKTLDDRQVELEALKIDYKALQDKSIEGMSTIDILLTLIRRIKK